MRNYLPLIVGAICILFTSYIYGQTGCYTIDWETDCNGNPFPEGLYIPSDAYDCIGVTITNNSTLPLVLFNSSAPTGGDVDLGTPSSNCPTCTGSCPGQSNDPNGGLTNCTDQGLVVITEENPADANGDGLEDNPDDHFQSDYKLAFDAPVTISTVGFIDDSMGDMVFTYSDGSTNTVQLTGGLDNDVYSQVFDESDVVCMQIILNTSGAFSLVDFCYDEENQPACDLVAPVLGADIDICEGTDPGPIEILSPATSTGVGTIMYQWQQSLVGCFGFGDIPGATAATYNPGVLVESTFFKVVVTQMNGNQVCIDESNCISYNVTTTPEVLIFPIANVCHDASAFDLAVSPEGGTFSGTGITSATDGTFDPSVSGIGTFTVTYNFTSGSCSGSDQLDLVVEFCCADPNCFGVGVNRN